jgi:hypothetical protein
MTYPSSKSPKLEVKPPIFDGKTQQEPTKTIVSFRPPEANEEDRVHGLKAEVERLACLPPFERLYWISQSAEQHVLKQMVEAQVRAKEKKKREAKAEEQKREQRAEKQRASEQRDQERQQRAQQQAAEKAKKVTEKAAEKEAGRKQRERAKEFAKLLQIPSGEQDARLVALAKRLSEDVDFVRDEFAQFVEIEEASKVSGVVEPWPDPVETGALLIEVQTQVRRYVVIHGDAETTAIVLWMFFAWLHAEVAVHSPLLVADSAEGDTGKSTLCAVTSYLTPRAYRVAEMTGPNLYRFVDHVNPTLIIDDADRLLPRKPDLVHIINVSWTKGTKIPRQDRGVTRFFDPFCPKLIAGVKVQLPATTATRRIPIKMWPKLDDEKVEDFGYADDDTFVTLRRKLARWSADNAAALKSAQPTMPAEMINRQQANWKLLLATADLAGGIWPKAAREAATKLSHQRRHEPSEGKPLLAAFQFLFAARGPMLTSADVQKMLTADPTSEWADYRGHNRPITQREIALLLDGYEIHPQVIHPRGRKADRGYRSEWFEKAFRHYLQTPPHKRTTVRKTRKTPEK